MAKTNYESVIILTPVLSEKMLQDAYVYKTLLERPSVPLHNLEHQ